MWRLLLSGTRGANWRHQADPHNERKASLLSCSLAYVDIAVLVGRSDVHVGQAVREDAPKPGGVAQVEDKDGLRVIGNGGIGA